MRNKTVVRNQETVFLFDLRLNKQAALPGSAKRFHRSCPWGDTCVVVVRKCDLILETMDKTLVAVKETYRKMIQK